MLAAPLFALVAATLAAGSPVYPGLSASKLVARQNGAPTVSISNGTLVGRSEPGFKQEFFLNVPYAQAPTGDLRLANPQPVNSTWTDNYDASKWGNVCPGTGISSTPNITLGQDYTLDEDCLNINIIRPAGVTEGDKLPVLFWIYGGGFIQGTANDPRYNGTYLVQRSVENGEPIIFASINYRLGAFGFPAGDAAAEQGVLNLGLKDQRLSLHWVQENIASFGGDPSKVTIWGQSAGGMSVASQLLAYGGRNDGLFRGAAIDSGIFAYQNNTLSSQQNTWSGLLNATGCTAGSDELSCLRALPYDTFFGAFVNSSYSGQPIPDGDFLLDASVQAIADAKVNPVPILVGATRDEATSGIGAPVGLNNETALRAAVVRGFRNVARTNASIDRLLELYPNDNEIGCPFGTGDGVVSTGLQDKRSNAMWTDTINAGSRFMAQKHGYLAPVWSWRFWQVPQNNTIDAGAAHANELPYLFGVLNRTVRTPLGNRPGDLDTSKRMQNYWLNFVNHLDPNVGASEDVHWPTYDSGSEQIIFQNNKTRIVKDDERVEPMRFQIQLALGQA
ncbi:carboxylesterase/lipase family protein [Rhodotorula paludigena]|uniref:carboxylesterase/lipase family protein n=1 Tax=Rhodotorula paludigena TaxID=86838 RepID=UPI00317A2DB3